MRDFLSIAVLTIGGALFAAGLFGSVPFFLIGLVLMGMGFLGLYTSGQSEQPPEQKPANTSFVVEVPSREQVWPHNRGHSQ